LRGRERAKPGGVEVQGAVKELVRSYVKTMRRELGEIAARAILK
jgi:hypothetical protein